MSTNGNVTSTDQLLERLNDPKVADGLNRLLDQLDMVTFAVESMEGFIQRGEVITESVAEGVREMKGMGGEETAELLNKAPLLLKTGTKLAEAASAMDVDELARSNVLERLTEPETLATLNALLDRLPLAAFLLESLEGFIRRGDTIAENLADAVHELHLGDSKIDPDQLTSLLEALPKFKEAGEKLLESELIGEKLPKVIDAGVTMVQSGMLDKNVVNVLGELGRKSAETFEEVASKPVEPIGGLFATLRATKDPDVQKSVGFFFAFAKAFAKHLP
jgi:uncharacterized protein YjgD (DUF1641 family)